jgi:hypothetical protein
MVRDRWDEEDELDRDRLRSREPEREPTLGEVIDGAVRKIVTGVVIAGGLIALGIWSSGGSDSSGSDLEYQIVTSADGAMVYRINTDSGSIVACRTASNACWLMQRASRDLEDEPPQNVSVPQPAQAAPPQQQAPAQVTPAQPAQQLPAPQNVTASAAR